jgi:cell division protein FtsX
MQTFKRYLRYHQQALTCCMQHCLSQKKSSLILLITIALSLTIPLLTLSIIQVGKAFNHAWLQSRTICAVLNMDVQPQDIEPIMKQIEKLDSVKKVVYINPEKGLINFSQQMHMDVSALSDENMPDLPSILLIMPSSLQHKDINQLVKKLHTIHDIQEIQFDWAWLDHLQNIISGSKKLLLTFCSGILLMIGLTLYYALNQLLLQQKSYMELLLMLGARKHYIKRPLYYFSCLLVSLATFLAFLFTKMIIEWVQPHIDQIFLVLRELSSSHLFIPNDILLQSIGIGYLVIFATCHLAVSNFLRKLDNFAHCFP